MVGGTADEFGLKEKNKAEVDATPAKKARARPLSEQMLGGSRPKSMYEDDEGVLSIFDAATNDLNRSPTATAKKNKLVSGSPLCAKNVVKTSRLRGRSRGYSAKSANSLVHALTTLPPPAPSVGILTSASASSTKGTAAIANQANTLLIATQIARWATLMNRRRPVPRPQYEHEHKHEH
ncbi:hypothetical protein CVT25_006168 [Psilocybe cyanescens]|uniref:Uncharacterized protein n=1 Tax=Psilocybe cyanescens TaxID=93625 RepID=A0A409XIN5_PSICY|nr:hypothetical protein CVT25_006168 [Psilocybe cyanescens]